jgi:hypothetical protein
MLDLSAAAVHAIKQSPMPLLMESLDVGRARERLLSDTRKQLALAEQGFARWIDEGAEIVGRINAEAASAKKHGQAIDLSPAIDLIEERTQEVRPARAPGKGCLVRRRRLDAPGSEPGAGIRGAGNRCAFGPRPRLSRSPERVRTGREGTGPYGLEWR